MEVWKSAECGSTEQALPGLCTHHGMDTSSDEFLDWREGHQASCEVNYCDSSSAMESTEAFAIWKWSVSKNKLRYTQMISDSDSKTFKLLSDQLPYGASNLVSKHECVWHVQKRIGTALREKAKEKFVNERREHVRMRGKGQITDKTIKLLTHYYGKAIRSNTGDCAAMQDAVWVVFYHFTSITLVASGLDASSTGHLPIPSHPHPTHPPSIQTLFLLSKRSLSDSLTLH